MIDRTYKMPIEVNELHAGILDERPGATAPLSSMARCEFVLAMVLIAPFFRFKREFAFGLEEKPDGTARYPVLWSFKGQEAMDLAGKHLRGIQFGMPESNIWPRFNSHFPDMQPRSATGHSSPTLPQGSIRRAKGDLLPRGLIPRVLGVPSQWPFPTPRATNNKEREGVPDVGEAGGNGGGYGERRAGAIPAPAAHIYRQVHDARGRPSGRTNFDNRLDNVGLWRDPRPRMRISEVSGWGLQLHVAWKTGFSGGT
jgi:hypothetical protein